MKPIRDRRKKIDEIDEKLVELLNLRARLAIEIGVLKRRNHLSAVSPARERAILRRVCHSSTGPLDREAIARLFRAILAESRRTAASSATAAVPGEYSR